LSITRCVDAGFGYIFIEHTLFGGAIPVKSVLIYRVSNVEHELLSVSYTSIEADAEEEHPNPFVYV
jgi:hypothetical protein